MNSLEGINFLKGKDEYSKNKYYNDFTEKQGCQINLTNVRYDTGER